LGIYDILEATQTANPVITATLNHESKHTQIQALPTPQQEKFRQLKEEGMERRKEEAKGEGESKQPQ
jgi:hypothetical protein